MFFLVEYLCSCFSKGNKKKLASFTKTFTLWSPRWSLSCLARFLRLRQITQASIMCSILISWCLSSLTMRACAICLLACWRAGQDATGNDELIISFQKSRSEADPVFVRKTTERPAKETIHVRFIKFKIKSFCSVRSSNFQPQKDWQFGRKPIAIFLHLHNTSKLGELLLGETQKNKSMIVR